MSSSQKELADCDTVAADNSGVPQLAAGVDSDPQEFASSSIPSVPQPPALPPRGSHPLPPPYPRHPVVQLPPFSPLSPLDTVQVPPLQQHPLVTPDTSPLRSSSVIACPEPCPRPQLHEVPTPVLPSHYLQSGHQLGYKLLS